MVVATKYPYFEVSLITTTLSVNIFKNWFLVATIIDEQRVRAWPMASQLSLDSQHFAIDLSHSRKHK